MHLHHPPVQTGPAAGGGNPSGPNGDQTSLLLQDSSNKGLQHIPTPRELVKRQPQGVHIYSVGRCIHDRYGPGLGAAANKRDAPPMAIPAPIVTAALYFVARREFVGKTVCVRLGRDGAQLAGPVPHEGPVAEKSRPLFRSKVSFF